MRDVEILLHVVAVAGNWHSREGHELRERKRQLIRAQRREVGIVHAVDCGGKWLRGYSDRVRHRVAGELRAAKHLLCLHLAVWWNVSTP